MIRMARSSRSVRNKDKLRKRQQRQQIQKAFHYMPVDNNWRIEKIDLLGIQNIPYPEPHEVSVEALPLTDPTVFKKIVGDGNCFFRCLSHILTGKENLHHYIRLKICQHMKDNPSDISSFLPTEFHGNVKNYLEASKMERDQTWASEVEIFTAAILLHTNIFVYTKHGVHWTWTIHSPLHHISNKSIYLYHKDLNHYDIVLSVENSPSSSSLSKDQYAKCDMKKCESMEKKLKRKLDSKEKYAKDKNFRDNKKLSIKTKYTTDAEFKQKKQEYSKKTKKAKYSTHEVFTEMKPRVCRETHHIECEWQSSLWSHTQKMDSSINLTFAEKKKQYERNRYKTCQSYKSKKKCSSFFKYCSNSLFRNNVKLLSKQKYASDKMFRDHVKQYAKEKYKQNSTFKLNVKEKSSQKYASNKIYRQNVKKYSKTKYSENPTHRTNVKKYSKTKYSENPTHRTNVKEYSKTKYSENPTHRTNVKEYSKTKYSENPTHRTNVKEYSKTKYSENLTHRTNVKEYSKTKYSENPTHRTNVKEHSKTKYSENPTHRRNVKEYSKTKYCENPTHRRNVKEYSKTKYSENPTHKENIKEYLKRKYNENPTHKEHVKEKSKRKYNENPTHKEHVKEKSKRKYSENLAHKENVKEYSKRKYRTFSSFRNFLKASSLKKYAKNPLFQKKLKIYLKNAYHSSCKVKEVKKKRVWKSRRTIDYAIRMFTRNVCDTPQFVCTVCARILFKKQVVKCVRKNYYMNDTLTEIASKCLTGAYVHQCSKTNCKHCMSNASGKHQEWICHTCHRYLKHGDMPPQSQANNLDLVPIPPVLARLNVLERQLISLRIPFMKLLSLPKGGQKGVKGPVVNVPSDLNTVTTSLPRNTSDAQLIKVKLKRKLSYKGHYSYKWINPTHVLDAVNYLIKNNSWYADITVDDDWLNNISTSNLIQPHTQEDKSDSDEESTSDNTSTESTMPVESCLQPVDIGQDILDTDKTLCLAPAENKIPTNIFKENGSDAMAFPTLLPDGHFGLFEERKIKLSPAKYFNSRLFCADTRFSCNKEFIFFAQYVTELNYISSNISLALRKGKQTTDDGKTLTASMLLDSENLSQILKSDIGYRFLQPVRGTPPYWQRTMKDLYAMIRQLGIPTWFVTFSAAEMRWDEVIQTLLNMSNDNRSVADIDWTERCAMVMDNPVMCARMFDHRVKALFSDLILSKSNPVGHVIDYFYRTEFQQRGSPHIHCLLWVNNAPKFMENTDDEVCCFVDQYITCRMPSKKNDPELYEIISSVQTHSKTHSKSCKKYSSACRFNFPRPPIRKTFIVRADVPDKEKEPMNCPPPTAEDLDKISTNPIRTPKQILREMWTVMSTSDHSDLSLTDILKQTNVTYSEYKQCLKDIATRNTIHIKRKTSDIWVNNYNEHLSRTWNANLDIQFVTDSYACVAYILSYISKAETEMGDLLQNAKKEADEGNTDAVSAMRKIGNVYLQNREVSAQEAIYRVCGMHLKYCSRQVVFIPAGSHILKMSLPLSVIKSRSKGTEEIENIWMLSIHDKYYVRPNISEFNDISLAEFCSRYRILSRSQRPVSRNSKANVYELKNGLGFVQRRQSTKEAIIRYPKFSINKNPEEYYLSLLQLYLPHRQAVKLPKQVKTYEDYVRLGAVNGVPVHTIIEKNRHFFEFNAEAIDQAWEDLQEGRIRPECWVDIAPEAEQERLEAQMEKEHVDSDQEDIPELEYSIRDQSKKPSFEYQAPQISHKDIQSSLRKMNKTQQDIFFKIKEWCLKTSWKQNPEPFHLFLTGGAGTGKSHLIKCVFHEATRILSKSTACPSDVCVLLTAPTGTAAFNIEGCTIHSALAISKNIKLPYQPLGENILNTLRNKFESLKLLIVDEISMVDQKLLTYIHGRLSQLKHSKKPFGGVSILAVGDFYQLPPVRGLSLYKRRDSNFIDLWKMHFTIATLTEVMRQKEDGNFASMLNRIRTHHRGDNLYPGDRELLEKVSCNTTPENAKDCLHIFPTNREVEKHNNMMVNRKCDPIYSSVAKDFSKDAVTGKLCQRQNPYSNSTSEDLLTTLQLGIGARVMLTRNIDTDDGLVNGAFGTVTGIDYVTESDIKSVYVMFDNSKIGLQHRRGTVVDESKEGSVKIKMIEDTLKGRQATRKQFPLKLGWAATIHKVQGMTVKYIAVSMKSIFQPGMAYVALSRATSLSGLHILDYKEDAIYSSEDIADALQSMPLFLPSKVNKDPTKHVTIVYHNTQGLLPHLEDVQQMTHCNESDIVCFTETWFTNKMTLPKSLLPRYTSIFFSREDAYSTTCPYLSNLGTMERGGVGVFCREGVEHTCHEHTTKNLELVSVLIKEPITFLLTTVYRPPRYPLQLFINNISHFLDEVKVLGVPSLIVGDFNDNCLQEETSKVVQTFKIFDYVQLVDQPTAESGSALDLVFINHFQRGVAIEIVPTYYSFHDAIKIYIEH